LPLHESAGTHFFPAPVAQDWPLLPRATMPARDVLELIKEVVVGDRTLTPRPMTEDGLTEYNKMSPVASKNATGQVGDNCDDAVAYPGDASGRTLSD